MKYQVEVVDKVLSLYYLYFLVYVVLIVENHQISGLWRKIDVGEFGLIESFAFYLLLTILIRSLGDPQREKQVVGFHVCRKRWKWI